MMAGRSGPRLCGAQRVRRARAQKRSGSRAAGQADQGEVADEAQPAQVAGQKQTGTKRAGLQIGIAEFAGAGIVQPQPAAVPARRMRHRQAAQDDRIGRHIDDAAAVAAMVAPAVDRVALGHRRDEIRLAGAHGEPVEMAAVLGRELADEGRPPDRAEACGVAYRRQAAEQVLTKIRRPAASTADRACRDRRYVADLGHVEAVIAVARLAGREHVLEAPDW